MGARHIAGGFSHGDRRKKTVLHGERRIVLFEADAFKTFAEVLEELRTA